MTSQRPYHVVVQRNGHGWRLRIDGIGGMTRLQARDLADVEPTARKLVWGYTGVNPADIELDIDLRLPPAIQMRLNLAEQLCEEATMEIEAVIGHLLDLGVSALDIGRILRRRGHTAPRPLTITNQEIVGHGLVRHPKALGVHWDDNGRFLTITCRVCLEEMRTSYLDLDPHGESVLIYDGPVRCHYCQHDLSAVA